MRADIEELVRLTKGGVEVYLDDTTKPPVGEGFNCPARVKQRLTEGLCMCKSARHDRAGRTEVRVRWHAVLFNVNFVMLRAASYLLRHLPNLWPYAFVRSICFSSDWNYANFTCEFPLLCLRVFPMHCSSSVALIADHPFKRFQTGW